MIFLNVCVRQTIPRHPLAITEAGVLGSLVLIVIGLAIRSWSAGTLNKSRELTTLGPYAVIRNPLYVGSFCMMAGFCILCRDMPTLLFVAGPLTALYWLQVRFEEQRLSTAFPQQWPQYASRTPRFVPRRLPREMFEGWSLFEWIRNREYNAIGASLVGIVCVWLWHWFRIQM